jgi:hypothetical protein
MTMQGQWPYPLTIDAVDPYPFHGLAYIDGGGDWLDPMDGRARIRLPALPGFDSQWTRFLPKINSAIWDIGKADPPQTAGLIAAGGLSLGRKLMALEPVFVARVAGVSRRLSLEWFGIGRFELRDAESGDLLATLEIDTDLVFDDQTLITNQDNQFDIVLATSTQLSLWDIAPDGRELLIALQATYYSAATTLNTSCIVAVLVLGITESAGLYGLNYSVAAGLLDCLGVLTIERDSDRYNYALNFITGEVTPAAIPADTNTLEAGRGGYQVPHFGSFSEGWSRSGQIVGGFFAGGGVEFLRFDTGWQAEVTGTASLETELAGSSYRAKRLISSATRTQTSTMRLHRGLAEVTGEYSYALLGNLDYQYNYELSGSFDDADFTFTTDIEESATELPNEVRATEFTQSGSPLEAGSFADAYVLAGSPLVPGKIYAPARPPFPGLLQTWLCQTGSTKAMALASANTGSGVCAVSGALTPDGTAGDWEEGTGYNPTLRRVASVVAYNPMTGQVARAVDMPARTITGWL